MDLCYACVNTPSKFGHANKFCYFVYIPFSITPCIHKMADSVSIFAEGSIEEQVCSIARTTSQSWCLPQLQELVEYLFRSQPEGARDAFKHSFAELVTTNDAQKPLAEDVARCRKAILRIVSEIHGLGDGTNKGAYRYPNHFVLRSELCR